MMKAIVGLWVLGIILIALTQKGDSRNEPQGKRDADPELSHKKPCTTAESEKTQCLNGGVCFAIEVGTRTAACNCQDGFAGSRCQFRAIDPAIIG